MKPLALIVCLTLIGCSSTKDMSHDMDSEDHAAHHAEMHGEEDHEAHMEAKAEITAMIETLFDGMRAGDSTAVRSVIADGASFRTVTYRSGQPAVFSGDPDGFVNAVGTPHDEVWDEKIWGLEIRVDDPLATAWMDYAFYLGDTFSHCGVNAMQLFNSEDGWKIVSLTDSRRRTECEVEN